MSTDSDPAQGADRLYRALVETSNDVIALIGVDGRNPGLLELLQAPPKIQSGGTGTTQANGAVDWR